MRRITCLTSFGFLLVFWGMADDAEARGVQSARSYSKCQKHIAKYTRRTLKKADLSTRVARRYSRCISQLIVYDFIYQSCRCTTKRQAARCFRKYISKTDIAPSQYAIQKARFCGVDTERVQQRFEQELANIDSGFGY